MLSFSRFCSPLAKPFIFQLRANFLPNLLLIPMASLSPRYLLIFLVSAFFHVIRFSCYSATGKEKTLAMIKPDGLSGNYEDQVKKMALDSGFCILRERRIQFDEGTAMSFSAEHSSKSFFPSLIKYMTSGPVLVMILEKENAVADWRNLIGPTDAEKAKVTHPHRLLVSADPFLPRKERGRKRACAATSGHYVGSAQRGIVSMVLILFNLL